MNCLATTIIITCKPTLISDMAVAIDPFSDKFPYFSRSSQRCRLQSLTNLDFNFLAQSFNHSVEDDNIPRSVSSPCFSIAASANMEEDIKATTAPRIEILGGQRVPTVRALVAEVTMAMVSGAQPLLLPSGMGGAYLLQTGKGHNIAVAKPVDEEPLAFNNPKKSGNLMLGQPGMKHSIPVGETGIRELAAYLLDYQGFSGVPPTALVSISHVPFHVSDAFSYSSMPYKVASLQRFVGHDYDAGELGPGSFTVTSVHRIGILDVRVLNLDRHAGNMLVKRCDKKECYNRLGTAELVPIDHGLCLPEFLDDPYFEWLNWPQAFVPFTDYELQYISNLDPFKDAELLRTELHSLPESAIRVLIVCTVFLKHAAAAGLCLAEIGEKMTRDFSRGEESFSLLETFCTKAKASVVDKTGKGGDYSQEANEVNTELVGGTFKFDGGDTPCEAEISEVFSVSKPPLVPRGPRANTIIATNVTASMLSSQNQRITHLEKNAKEKRGGKQEKCNVRSKSPPIGANHDESKGVSFVDLTTVEWEMFLQSFKTLLQDALSKGSTPR
ncbi:PREDICTED: phosphatidylinositol 4-kinase gamma 1-like [Camelina sativa]|uniref:1-phosphatidylinositol 4-kinase n=1 Tax=Camelina sativa TaxID=90675 RepID=A0ABM0YTZ8_CAMSA|nr:PREDICTED: phosphatidylinositol 4-kinase gamma 1-like [Camelina sativa]